MTEKLLDNRKALANIVKRIAIKAGDITLKYFDEDGFDRANLKEDGSPVTIADQEAEIHIEKALLGILPGVPMIGEESVSGGRITDLSDKDYFWLVDPLDGTKEFISGGGNFTVNIGLIKKGQPVLGVVYAPILERCYFGYTDDDGASEAFIIKSDEGKEKTISVRKPPAKGLTVVASKRHGDKDRLTRFLENFKVEKLINRGSSLKICIIAEGKADLYPRFGPTCEWDTAAAHAVLSAAGGRLTTIDGQQLPYGGANPKYLNPEFIAAGFDWQDVE